MDDWVIVDANVIVKAFVEEPASALAGRLWASDTLLGAPAHALAEVGEVIRRKRTAGQVTDQQLLEISLALPGAINAIGLDDLFNAAMEIALEVSQSFYDCLYLAAADRWDCPFITADDKFRNSVARTRWQQRVNALSELDSMGIV